MTPAHPLGMALAVKGVASQLMVAKKLETEHMDNATSTLPKPRLLVVDDEPIVCQSCERIFAPSGYDVESTTDSHDGLARALSSRYDAIVLDIKMPSLDGVAFLDRLHRGSRRLPSGAPPVIAISGHSDKRAESAARRLGIAGYLAKPFRPDEIRAAVGDALKISGRMAWARVQTRHLSLSNDLGAIERLRLTNRRGERVTLIISGILRRESGAGQLLVERLLSDGYPLEVSLGGCSDKFRAAIDEIQRCDRLLLLALADQKLPTGTVACEPAGEWARAGGADPGTVSTVQIQPASETASPSAFPPDIAAKIASSIAELLL